MLFKKRTSNYTIEELREITKNSSYKEIKEEMYEAALQGESSMLLFQSLNNDVKEKLKEEGYKIKEISKDYCRIYW
jgi:hypothetical protein